MQCARCVEGQRWSDNDSCVAVRAAFGVAAVSKTPEQVAKERKEFERKRQLKAMRRAEQERNVKRKEDEKAAKRQAKKDRREAKKQAQLHAGMVAMEEDEGDLEVVAGERQRCQ